VIDYVNVEKVTISGSETALGGTTVPLTAAVEPQDAANQKINWASSDTSIATVDESGNVTCADVEKLMTVKITAIAADNYMIMDEFILSVVPAVKSITIVRDSSFDSDMIDIELADNMQLSAVCVPSGASQKVTWTSSNTEIATLDDEGVVNVLKGGEVTFTATATDGSGVSASVTVTFVRFVEDIVITGSNTALGGSVVQLTAVITPENATNKNVLWSSSDESVATVDDSGRVTCAKVEEQKTVTITAVSAEDDYIWVDFVLTVNPSVEGTGN
jgi:Bacterial surface proteins containing Ig-like domains